MTKTAVPEQRTLEFNAVRPDEYRGEVTSLPEFDPNEAREWVRVRPIVGMLFERARVEAERQRMIEGYREMGEFDREWAERDLPATFEVLPPQ